MTKEDIKYVQILIEDCKKRGWEDLAKEGENLLRNLQVIKEESK